MNQGMRFILDLAFLGISDLFMLTPADIAEFFDEFEDSGSKIEENKTPDASKDTPEKASE